VGYLLDGNVEIFGLYGGMPNAPDAGSHRRQVDGAGAASIAGRVISGISQKMLTQTLRSLERDGLVTRKVYAEVPPRVEYTLTPLGETLIAPIAALSQWSEDHIGEVLAAQEQYDAQQGSD
jgi:DNA-binding MarR family transcriptional regulator